MSEPLPDAIPAATVIVFREAANGPPELLMVERGAAMALAGGAMVFPGGRVDPGDRLLAATLDGDPDDLAARIAAARECLEEAGLPIGLDLPNGATPALRAALHAGRSIGEALSDGGGRVAPDRLVPFARWRPAHRHARIFDTRFYLARLPANAPPASVDHTENTRLIWIAARAMLDEADAGRARIIFPTRRNLERLAQFGAFDEAAAHARAHPIGVITPWEEERDGEPRLCIPEGAGYPVTSERLVTASRG